MNKTRDIRDAGKVDIVANSRERSVASYGLIQRLVSFLKRISCIPTITGLDDLKRSVFPHVNWCE
jgi:hypothetical protein